MRQQLHSIFVVMAALAACWINARQVVAEPHAAAAIAPGTDSAGGSMPANDEVANITGKVVETMDAGRYTYVRVDDGSKKVWVAAPQLAVAVGDEVVVPQGSAMRNFESKTLGRTFDLIHFVGEIRVVGSKAAPPDVSAVTGAHRKKTGPVALDVSNIQKADGGHTVAELFANKTGLAGKEVAVRGKVAKLVRDVMGKNWIHVQDGTGSPGSNDLTVTTTAAAAVGSTVLVRGKLVTDRDFGFGYQYEVIIEDAAVTVE